MMKAFLALCLLALSGVLAEDSCYQDVTLDCTLPSNSITLRSCNAIYGDYGHHGSVHTEMKSYANLHLQRSFDYLLSASYFNNFQTNRAGFSKVFRKLSDNAWEKTIDLIKHITERGDAMDFSIPISFKREERKNYTVEVEELGALAKALDTQKEIAERAFHIHKEATRNNEHDPEIAQYLEEEFIEKHSKQIREMAGFTNDLKKFIVSNNGQDLSLSLYLFDEYLQKVV